MDGIIGIQVLNYWDCSLFFVMYKLLYHTQKCSIHQNEKASLTPHSRLAHVFVNLVWGIVWRKEPEKTFASKQVKITPTYCAFILDHGMKVAAQAVSKHKDKLRNSVLATPVHFQILLEVY